MFEAPTLETLAGYNWQLVLPAIALGFGTMFMLLVDLFLPPERKYWTPRLALAGVFVSFVLTLFTYNPGETQTFAGMFVVDTFTGFLNLVLLATAFMSILLSSDYLSRMKVDHGEYYTLMLLSTTGAMFMVGANDLVTIFVALELLSIPLYVLAAFRATDDDASDEMSLRSEEAGMKYFILGAFSSAFLVYGSALIFGATGTTNLNEIFASVQDILAAGSTSAQLLLLMGASLAFVGLGFKVAVVPFHMWTPDVYEGSPTPVTAFMSVAAKVGGFGALLRLTIVGLSGFSLTDGDPATWQTTIWLISAVTLLLGNFVAIAQTSVKRMLAYSSIAHAGYILMAVAAAGSAGVGNVAAQGAAVYLGAYMFTNLGAFAVVMTLENEDGSGTTLDDFMGLANSSPLLAAAMAIFMLSLVGIPLTGGFLGKWLVFGAAVQAGLIPLVVIGVLTSVVSAFYYMRVVVNMYLNTEAEGSPTPGATQPVRIAIYAAAAGTLIVGILVPLVMNLVDGLQLI